MSEEFADKKIWVIEDDLEILSRRKELLERHGATIELFDNPLSAATQWQKLSSDPSLKPPDLIITDYDFSPTPHGDAMFWQPEKHDLPHGALMMIDAVKNSDSKELRAIPVIILTGDSKAQYHDFTGANVSVFTKATGIEKLLSLLKKKLFPSLQQE